MGAAPTVTAPIREGHATALVVAVSALTLGTLWVEIPGDGSTAWQVRACVPAVAGAVGVLLLRPLAARTAATGADLVLAFALLPALVLSLGDALSGLAWTLVRSIGEGYADGLYPHFGRILALITAVAVCRGVAPVEAAPSTAPGGPRRRAAALWVAALAAMCLVAAGRVRRLPRMETYLARLPVVGAVPALTSPPDGTAQEQLHAAGPVRLRRVYVNGAWQASIARPEPPRAEVDRWSYRDWHIGGSAARVCLDRHLDAVIFESPHSRSAFCVASGQRCNVRRYDLLPWHAPPPSWVASSLVGLALAGALLAWPRRAPASLLRWRGARQGTLSPEGVVTFADGAAPVSLPDGHRLAPGPVLVLDDSPGTPFRGAPCPPPGTVVEGTRQGVLHALACVERDAVALALAIATVTSAPLLVALAFAL